MKKYAPEKMELSARDVVARAIYMEVKKGNGTRRDGVWLDISHRSKNYIKKRLPLMYSQFKKYAGIDISKQKMEVAPTAHYSMGGILIDHTTGKTGVKNLYAIGEVTSGVHGGNRLGGNSLAEITVFGRLTAKSIIKELKKINFIKLDNKSIETEINNFNNLKNKNGKNPINVIKDIQSLMWENVGVMRNGKNMTTALKKIQNYKKIKLNTGNKLKMNEKLVAALDVNNMIPTCEMIVRSALFRKESRSAHYRNDYRKTEQKWEKNIICGRTSKGFKLKTRKVSPVPREITKYIKRKVKVYLLE